MTDLSRDYLNDGYISYTFGLKNAEDYMVILLRTDAQNAAAECGQIRRQNGAFYVFIKPSLYSPPTALICGQNAWLIGHKIKPGGFVVPQKFWSFELHGNWNVPNAYCTLIIYDSVCPCSLLIWMGHWVPRHTSYECIHGRNATAEQSRFSAVF